LVVHLLVILSPALAREHLEHAVRPAGDERPSAAVCVALPPGHGADEAAAVDVAEAERVDPDWLGPPEVVDEDVRGWTRTRWPPAQRTSRYRNCTHACPPRVRETVPRDPLGASTFPAPRARLFSPAIRHVTTSRFFQFVSVRTFLVTRLPSRLLSLFETIASS
jgi:hypothetical protein